jgi:two-component system, chemotaxis family, CheB/CheR fusion protein
MSYSYDDLYIVGVGSSAGGIEALKALLSTLPKDQPLSYIIVQHLNPQYKSMLTDILSRETDLEVEEISNGTKIEPMKIYVTPSNANVTVVGGRFITAVPEQLIGPKPSVDVLFVSLAQEKGEKVIGIILSGTGSDGTMGLKAIKASGGMTLAHDPKNAKYNGMPLSAIEERVVDKIMLPEEMGPYMVRLINDELETEFIDIASDALHDIYAILNTAFDVDFSSYKPATVLRRLEKRMGSVRVKTLAEYLEHLRENRNEVTLLYNDILIGVTSFYRDFEAFEALANVLRGYLDAHTFPEFRVWSAGCCTGEESYTLAMILSDMAEQLGKKITIQVFATDLDEASLSQARSGVYPEIISAAIPKIFLEKYFRKRGSLYEVVRPIREKVIFSKHNLLRDPPFLRVDLTCCRNLLIYFETEIQNKTILNFHHALRPGGIMFLGKSESLGKASVYFSAVSTKFKIFKSRADVKPQLFEMIMPRPSKPITQQARLQAKKELSIEDEIKRTLYDSLAGRLIVVDENGNLLFVKGEFDGIASLPKGSANLNFSKMINDQLSVDFRSLLFKAAKYNLPQIGSGKVVSTGTNKKKISIAIYPLGLEVSGYLVLFDEQDIEYDDSIHNGETSDEHFKELQQELDATREHLQTVVEELETANEELQAANEELQSSNEELQATNEELETSNEELQSSNEELQTAYIELKMVYDDQGKQREFVEEANRELVRLNNELGAKENYISALLDAEQAMVIVTRMGEEIIDANQGFFSFFGNYSSLDEFKVYHKCICELFEDVVGDDNFLPSGNVLKDGKNWLELVMSGAKQYKVMISNKGKPYIFSVHANDLDILSQRFVVVFSNITDIEDERVQNNYISNKNLDEMRQKERAVMQRAILYSMSEYIGSMASSWREPMAKLSTLTRELIEDAEYEAIKKDRLKEFENESLAYMKKVLTSVDATKEFFALSKNKEYFNVLKLLEESVDVFKSHFKGKLVEIENLACEKEKIDFYGYSDEIRILLHDVFILCKNYLIDKEDAKVKISADSDAEHFMLIIGTKDEDMLFHNHLIGLLNSSSEIEGDVVSEIEQTQMKIVKSIVEAHLGGSITMTSNAITTEVVIKMKLKS